MDNLAESSDVYHCVIYSPPPRERPSPLSRFSCGLHTELDSVLPSDYFSVNELASRGVWPVFALSNLYNIGSIFRREYSL